jgi:formylmethanofuran dehydrogenase subunit B
MITDPPLPRFCSCCSLLCESPSFTDDFGASYCSRRNRELDTMGRWIDESEAIAESTTWESTLQESRNRLAMARPLLVTGRIRCVESSRGALRIAERFNATVDLWDSDASFESVAAFQRVGGMNVSLGEARDLSQGIIVIGSDELLEEYPKLPAALSRGAAVPVLLLGRWSDRGCKPWLGEGFEPLAIDTPIEHLPRSLMEASQCSPQSPWDNQVSRWLHPLGYTTVVWSLKHLSVQHGDLWVEDLMRWIAIRNESSRCGALAWGGLESTFQQVCTWWTGFPGRVRFQNNACAYDPSVHSSKLWFDHPSQGRSMRSLVLWIDDSFDELPTTVLESKSDMVVIGARRPVARPNTIWLPSLRAGLGLDSQFFRGDQAILVHGRDPLPIAKQRPSVHDWLLGLLEP